MSKTDGAAAGDHDEDSKLALQTGLEMVLKLAQNDTVHAVKRKVSTEEAVYASIMMYEMCGSDGERLAALRLISKVFAHRPSSLEGCYPADGAHWICAKAYNAATLHMRARDKQLAESFMSITVDLCKNTECAAITVDMCRETAKKFSCQIG